MHQSFIEYTIYIYISLRYQRGIGLRTTRHPNWSCRGRAGAPRATPGGVECARGHALAGKKGAAHWLGWLMMASRLRQQQRQCSRGAARSKHTARVQSAVLARNGRPTRRRVGAFIGWLARRPEAAAAGAPAEDLELKGGGGGGGAARARATRRDRDRD